MNKNDLVNVTITDLGTDGEGIGKCDGFTLFVTNAVPGDVVKAHVLKVKKTYAYAKTEEIIEASSDRCVPPCPVAYKCGGCRIQHIKYEKQLEIKEKKVKDCLTRLGGVDPKRFDECFCGMIGMDEPWGYRNKAQFPVGTDEKGNVKIGCYAFHSHAIIENDGCLIENPACAGVLSAVRAWIREFGIVPYNEGTGKGELRHVFVRFGKNTGEMMVCLVVNIGKRELSRWNEDAPMMKNLWKKLNHEFIKSEFSISGLCLNLNSSSGNVILGDEVVPVFGNPFITDRIGDILYKISPLSFFQVNPVQTKKLYDIVLEFADLSGKETVWDLYCGIGTISLFLAKKAKKVFGVEIVPEAIENAKENAIINGIGNTEFFCGAAEDVLLRLNHELTNAETCDVAVVDPPRAGCDPTLLSTLVRMDPNRIVYVSCDPATLGRDVKILAENGYEVTRVAEVDQFCQTMHVETVCLMSRKDN